MFLNAMFNFLNHAVQKCCFKLNAVVALLQGKSMSNEKRRIGLFGATGVLVAALIIASFVFAGNIFQASGKGVLTIQVMDKPVELKHLNITIDSVRIQGENGWTDLTLKTEPEPFYFDLLA